MIRLTSTGSFKKTRDFLSKGASGKLTSDLAQYGRRGVEALRAATPVESGATAGAWSYGVEQKRGHTTIFWTNNNENNGVKIAVIIQHGHGTGTGGYVSGIDYINPALRPVFDEIAADVWRKVTNA